jgi:transcriptional regulator with XRE-family HTH domain
MKSQKARTPRRALKIALMDAGLRQRDLAALTHIEETTVSRILNGEYRGTPAQRKAIAKALLRSIHELFPEGLTA